MEINIAARIGIIIAILIHTGICINTKPDPRNPTHCLQRKKDLPSGRCKKSCLRDSDCRASRKCWCDGICGRSCIRMNTKCPKLRDIPNGRVIVNEPGNRFGSIAQYLCDNGYSFKEDPTPRVCQGDETWSYGKEPQCIDTKCPKLRDIPNGCVIVNEPGNRFGSIAQYLCDNGYSFKEDPTPRVCQGDETWSYGKEPQCIESIINCPPPPVIENAYNDAPTDQVRFPISTMFSYACLEGYQSQPDSVITAFCPENGQWVGPILECTHDGCTDLDDIKNGWVEQNKPNYRGSSAKFYCNVGFFLYGDDEILCNEDGQWVGAIPSCGKVTCGSPPTLKNGRYVMENVDFVGDFNQFTSGQRFYYTCEYGYRSNGGDRIAVCGGQGEWIGPELKCEAQNCGPPGELTYGRIVADYGYASPSRITFICDKGFLLRGHSDSVCQPSGHWSNPIPRCEPINCPPLQAPMHGYMDRTGISYGSVVRFTCEVGYRLRGPSERRCQPDKSWTGQEVYCEEIDCGQVFFDNGRIVGPKTTYGSEITYQCREHTTYGEIHTPFTAICLDDGTWSNPPPKCLGHCLVPEIKNATILGSQGNQYEKHGNVVEYRCKKGFTATDSTRMVCNNGTWSSQAACVPAPCPFPPPHLPFGIRVYLDKDHGDMAKYRCNPGYRMSGLKDGSHLVCQYGEWVGGEPVCEEIYCPSPTQHPIEHGKIWKKVSQARFIFKEYILRIRHGDMLEYECDEGYRIDGPGGATCVDGEWQPPLDNPKTKCVPALHPPFIKLWTPLPNLTT